MSKFDRCIFISIAIGIWTFVLTQFFVPEPLIAHDDGHSHYEFAEEYHSHDYAESYHDHDYAESSHSHDYAESYHDHDVSDISGIKKYVKKMVRKYSD